MALDQQPQAKDRLPNTAAWQPRQPISRSPSAGAHQQLSTPAGACGMPKPAAKRSAPPKPCAGERHGLTQYAIQRPNKAWHDQPPFGCVGANGRRRRPTHRRRAAVSQQAPPGSDDACLLVSDRLDDTTPHCLASLDRRREADAIVFRAELLRANGSAAEARTKARLRLGPIASCEVLTPTKSWGSSKHL